MNSLRMEDTAPLRKVNPDEASFEAPYLGHEEVANQRGPAARLSREGILFNNPLHDIDKPFDSTHFGETLTDSFRNKNTIHAVINRADKILKKALFFGKDLLLAYHNETLVRVVLAHNIKETVFELREEEEKDPIISIGGTPRGTFLAIAWNLKFHVYDLSKPGGMQLVVERKTTEAGLFVQEINFSPDGSKLAVAIQSGVQIYAGANWQLAAD